ncbi:hypothetical protein D9M71_707920 [compost metagenome]
MDVELFPFLLAFGIAQPAHQFASEFQLGINCTCVGIAQPLIEGIARQHTSAAHALGIDQLDTLNKAEHGSQTQHMLGASGGERLQASELPEWPALAFNLVAEVHPYLFSLCIRLQNGWGDLTGFRVNMFRAGSDLFAARPVRLQTRVCVGLALQ